MGVIKNNNKNFLDKDFMNNLYSNIHVKDNGKRGPLEPLVEYMKYYMGKLKLRISFFSNTITLSNTASLSLSLFLSLSLYM